ncbi:hypothetical protein Agub_g7147 [Astrephomene gubernaculifera]|uniref:C2 domain-containing protein n=1 Tax=Astrephomene gubernaculifera TaxID=47775 RepID=A0AAD3DPM6_9CHLO|nr:hypothetical protein Agub_g7147 [Astrephomene gubernaculifera]
MLHQSAGHKACHRQQQLARCSSSQLLVTPRRVYRPQSALFARLSQELARRNASCHAVQPDFDLALAVPLAHASFDAYSPPAGAKVSEGYKAVGTMVTCLNPDFLKTAFQGMLEVTVLSASGLRNTDTLSKSDPYVVVTHGSRGYRTATKDNTLNPVWDAKAAPVKIPVVEAVNGVLSVQLYDEDQFRQGEELGQASLPLAQLGGQGEKTLTLPLSGKGAAAGSTVTLRCRMRLWSEMSAAELASFTADNTSDAAVEAVAGLKVAEAAAAALAADTVNGGAAAPQLPGNVQAAAAQDAAAAAAAAECAQWRDLAVQMGGREAEQLLPLAFVDATSTDTQAWMLANKESKTVVLSFRGTETSQWKDIFSDLNLFQIQPKSLKPKNPKITVHKGFLAAYESIRETITALLETVLNGSCNGCSSNGSNWRILVTGHSLGGALATLASYDLKLRDATRDITCYTYGAPRVGNKAFAEEYNSLVPHTFRVTNKYDIVASVPRVAEYTHVGRPVQPAGEGGALQVVQPAAELSFEKKMLDKGPNYVISQHMGYNYLATFQKAVKAVGAGKANEEDGKKKLAQVA